MALAEKLPRWWFRPRLALPLLPLLPLSWLFGTLSWARRTAFRRGWKQSTRLPVPVVVVGNLIVGGAGKTPLVIALAEALSAAGWHPGIISRGYGAGVQTPNLVDPMQENAENGDEPQMMARRTGLPVAVCRDRIAAARCLLKAHPETDILISDDGLQHYALARDVEIVVFDARGAGNGRLLPGGPLREPLTRLGSVDAIVLNGEDAALPVGTPQHAAPCFTMRLRGERFVSLKEPGLRCRAEDLQGKELHAFAGIGDPARFFRHLAALGLTVRPHAFADHHPYTAADFAIASHGTILLTEKDAVKCGGLIRGDAWVLPVSAEIEPGLTKRILEKLNGRKAA